MCVRGFNSTICVYHFSMRFCNCSDIVVFFLITGFVTRLTRRVSLVEQELFILPEHPSSPLVFSGVCDTQPLVLCVCFVDRCLSFWPLCICRAFAFLAQVIKTYFIRVMIFRCQLRTILKIFFFSLFFVLY